MDSRISAVLWMVSDHHLQCADRSDDAARDLLFADALSCLRRHCHSLLRGRSLFSGAQGDAGASSRNYPGRVMTEVALQTVNLVRRVQGVITHTLVNGIDLSVAKGEFLAITGPSGSGKSSLLYLLGLLDAPTEGEVIICGQPTSKLSETERADAHARLWPAVSQGNERASGDAANVARSRRAGRQAAQSAFRRSAATGGA